MLGYSKWEGLESSGNYTYFGSMYSSLDLYFFLVVDFVLIGFKLSQSQILSASVILRLTIYVPSMFKLVPASCDQRQ